MLLGLRIATGQKPSLPGMILRREVKYATLEKMVNFALKLCGKMEKVVKPRMHFMQRWPGMMNLIGIGIASGGLQLCLPLPPLIPFSNFIPGALDRALDGGADGAGRLGGIVRLRGEYCRLDLLRGDVRRGGEERGVDHRLLPAALRDLRVGTDPGGT